MLRDVLRQRGWIEFKIVSLIEHIEDLEGLGERRRVGDRIVHSVERADDRAAVVGQAIRDAKVRAGLK